MALNLMSIFSMLLANPDKIEATVTGLIDLYKATTAPQPVVVPSVPASGTTSALPSVVKKPNEAVRALQGLLNRFMSPTVPLDEDGWLGDKTEKMIMLAIVKLEPLLAQLKH